MNSNWAVFLGGKVKKQSLPCVSPGGDIVPDPKRLLLPQGELASLYDENEPARYLAFIELIAGTARGNHYHEVKREFIYFISGEVELICQDLESRERVTLTLKAGDRVFIAPRVAHVIKVMHSGQAVEFSPNRFDSRDIQKMNLL